VTIEAGSPSSAEESGDAEMFENIMDGYDVSIKKETADAWYINCRKSKSNTNKDDPQKMELVVRKGTFHPISLSTKISGVTLTMKDLRFGVSETEVTFDIKQYPGAKIVDKREKNLP
jgi:outer membrane lipoprotein-sorting protein